MVPTRYLWDKSTILHSEEIEKSNKYEGSLYISPLETYACFSTGVSIAADGTYTMTGSVKEYKRPSDYTYGTYEDATTYKYAAPKKTGNKFYAENTEDHVPSYWYISSDGLHSKIILRENEDYIAPQYTFDVHKLVAVKGDPVGLVSSDLSNAYPQNDPKDGFWYAYKGSDSIDPLSVTYSMDRPERGKPVTVAVEPAPVSGGTPQWSASTLPASAVWSGVAYGGGWFVAVGGGDAARIARSSDNGKTWSPVSNTISGASAIAYANGRFVLVGLNAAAYSTDNGATWTTAANFPNGQWSSVCYGGGKFVAVDSAADKAMWSSDGNVWVEISLPSGGGWYGIAYGNGRFVATSYRKIAYSDNLSQWTAVQVYYKFGTWRGITFADGKFVIVGSDEKIAYSANAENWTASAPFGNIDLHSVSYGNGKFFAVGFNDNSGETTSVCSADAVTWESLAMPSSKMWNAVAYGESGFVAVSMLSDAAAYLPDEADLGYTVSYLYQYSINGGSSWITVGAATTNTQIEITIPESAEQFMARVRAQDDIGFTSADYVTGANLAVQTMRLWVGVANAAKQGRKLWVGVDGTARRVVRAWVGDENGTARRWF